MYNIGTVTTTANSNKLVGTGTKWKENINGIQPQQVIQIVVGGIIYSSSIQSIESDTAITLNFPFHAVVKDAEYVILTTMVNSVSSAANYMVALNTLNMQARDVANAFMTQEGTVAMTAPDGTKVNLRTTKEMDKQLNGKLDKAGGEVSGELKVKANIQAVNAVVQAIHTESGVSMQLDATFAEPNVRSKRKTSNWRRHILPDADGTLMHVGDFGIGGTENNGWIGSVADMGKNKVGIFNIMHTTEGMKELGLTDFYGSSIVTKFSAGNSNTQVLLLPNYGMNWLQIIRKGGVNQAVEKCNVWTDKNTTKDSNGNLKPASPIIKVFADHIELNEESEGVELEKLSTGGYKLKGTLGMNSDASWGGYHGGLVIPNGINNLPLVWADFKVEADGDIIIETHYRKHADLPPPVVLNRLITYPEFMDENGNELDSYTPCDIPNGHWIDVRVNMPSDSLYNQKQAEAQRLAEIEAERLAKEEADNVDVQKI